MEKGSPRRMKSHLCIPRLRGTSTPTKSSRLSPMTLLERFREAVFRLMMVSALSKATSSNCGPPSSSDSNHAKRSYYHPADAHHSEAVADCIEFIKKKAVADVNGRDSTASSSSSIDATAEMVMPVPVIWHTVK